MLLYLDEMFPPVLGAMLRAHGLDAVSALDLLPSATPDETHLTNAADLGRCLVTKDLRDFRRLTLEFMEQERPHAGVLIIPRSVNSDDFALLVSGLAEVCTAYPDGLPPYMLLWLPNPRR